MSERPPARGTRSSGRRSHAVVRCRKTKVVEAEAYPPRYDVITLDPHDTLQKGGAKARDRTTSVTKLKSTEQKSYATRVTTAAAGAEDSAVPNCWIAQPIVPMPTDSSTPAARRQSGGDS